MSKSNVGGETSNKESENGKIPEEFGKIVRDFIGDIIHTFPEYEENLNTNLKILRNEEDENNKSLEFIFTYCKTVFPERFFDILYKNDEMFKDTEKNTIFMPDLEFKDIWADDISDTTRETIWKYLQLLLFTIVGNVSDGESFGETAKLFEAINETELKKKLEETVDQMQDFFDISGIDLSESFGMDNLPTPESIHDHISGLMDGKLGTLAREIAEETAAEIDIDMGDAASVKDVFEKLFKNPGKLMGLIKNVGSKLDHKIKSGEIKESELVKEASDLMKKMKDMPGMGNLDSMLSKMGMSGAGKGKVNMGAFQAQMDKNLKTATTRERMQRKLEERRKMREQMNDQMAAQSENQSEPQKENLVFSTGEKVERTPRNAKKEKRRRKKKGKKINKK